MDYIRNVHGNILFWCAYCCMHMLGDYCTECGSRTRYARADDMDRALEKCRSLLDTDEEKA